jgi:hypothetical protein
MGNATHMTHFRVKGIDIGPFLYCNQDQSWLQCKMSIHCSSVLIIKLLYHYICITNGRVLIDRLAISLLSLVVTCHSYMILSSSFMSNMIEHFLVGLEFASTSYLC